MIQFSATLLSLIGLMFTRQKLAPGPLFGMAGSGCWVLYGLQIQAWGLVATETAFVIAYYAVYREWNA